MLEQTSHKGIQSSLSAENVRVVRIHYSADPDKDPSTPAGENWLKRELQGYRGMSDPRWRKEMEVDFQAQGGQLLFPFLAEFNHAIYVNPRPISETAKLTAGFDYGTRNPSSLQITMWDETTGHPETIWEYYEEPRKKSETDEDFRARKGYKATTAALKACPHWEQLKRGGGIAADPSLWSMTQQTQNGLKSIADLYGQEGVHMFPAERGGDMAWYEYVSSKWWANPVKPDWKIWRTCPWLWQELQGLRFAEWSASTAVNQNPKDKIVDKANHAVDAIKYDFMLRLKSGFSKPSEYAQSHAQRIVSFVTGKTKKHPWDKRPSGNHYIPDNFIEA